MLEQYIVSGGKKLRCGYTTGSCAAAAAKAAAYMLASKKTIDHVSIATPKGIQLILELEKIEIASASVSCAVRKDGGDDADATDGILICAKVSLNRNGEITVDGGQGVGRVTRAGLDQPIGAAAINHVPREMIADHVRRVLEKVFGKEACMGADVVISVPQGETIAPQTFNPRLGIEGGISILGTTGIVEPMSEAALLDTIKTELKMLRTVSDAPILMTPGNYGENFAEKVLGLGLSRSVMCSNFLGEALDYAAYLGFQSVLLVGHIGKLIKVAGGIFQTHSRVADARMEILAAHAAMAGATQEWIRNIMDCVTTDQILDLLEHQNLLKPVMDSVMLKIEEHLRHRVGRMPTEAILFSNQYGILGKTSKAEILLCQLKTEEPK